MGEKLKKYITYVAIMTCCAVLLGFISVVFATIQDVANFDFVMEYSVPKYNLYTVVDGARTGETIIDYGGEYVIEPVVKSGYTFNGWFTKNEDGERLTDENGRSLSKWDTPIISPIYDAEGNILLNSREFEVFANFSPITYRIDFHKCLDESIENNIFGSNFSQTFTYGEEQLLIQNSFIYSGYKFSDWVNSDGVKIFDNNQAVLNFTDTNNEVINVYANWEPCSYSIKYHKNNLNAEGEDFVLQDDENLVYNSTSEHYYTKDDALFSYPGYNLIGWSTSSNGEGEIFNVGSEISGADLFLGLDIEDEKIFDLYAVWEGITYTVKYNSNNNNATGEMEDQIFKYGDVLDSNGEFRKLSANNFKILGYRFIGWNNSSVYNSESDVLINECAEIGLTVNSNLSEIENDEIELFAIWVEKEYTIIYHDTDSGEELIDNAVKFSDNYKILSDAKVVEKIKDSGRDGFEKHAMNIQEWSMFGQINAFTGFATDKIRNKENDENSTDFNYDNSFRILVNYYEDNTFSDYPYSEGTLLLNTNWVYNSYTIVYHTNYGTDVLWTSPNNAIPTYTYNGNWTNLYSENDINNNFGEDNPFRRSNFTWLYWSTTPIVSNEPIDLSGNEYNGMNNYINGDVYDFKDSTSILIKKDFRHWFKNLSAINNDVIHLYAIWQGQEYTISFNKNSATATGQMNSVVRHFGDGGFIQDSEFSNLGYIFGGWQFINLSDSNKNIVITDTTEITETIELENFEVSPTNRIIVLFAIWESQEYSISLNYFDEHGVSQSIEVLAKYNNEMPTSINNIEINGSIFNSYSGYTFIGFFDGENGSGTKYYSSSFQSLRIWDNYEQIEYNLYAYYSEKVYNIEFNFNNTITNTESASCSVVATFKNNELVYYNSAESEIDFVAPIRSGYTFTGYYTLQESGEQVISENGLLIANVLGYTNANREWIFDSNSTINLYAIWIEKEYNIEFNFNSTITNTENASCSAIVAYDSNELVYYNSAESEIDFVAPIRSGYTFTGYYTLQESGEQVISENGLLIANVLGYTNANREWTFDTNSTINLYAIWIEKEYNIEFNFNNGIGSSDTTSYSAIATYNSNELQCYNSSAVLGEFVAPTRTGYTYDGYYALQEFGEQVISENGLLVANVLGYTNANREWIFDTNSTITLYAMWVKNTYTVTLNFYPGTITGELSSVDVIATYDTVLPDEDINGNLIPEPSYSNLIFSGMYLNQNVLPGDVSYYNALNDYLEPNSTYPWRITQNTTLYAYWLGEEYTISYDCGEGGSFEGGFTPTESYRFSLNSQSILLNNPTKDYHDFVDWTITDTDLGSLITSGVLIENNYIVINSQFFANITLTANYTAKNYNITYILGGHDGISALHGEDHPNTYTYSEELQTITISNPILTGYISYWSVSSGTCSISGTTLTIPAGAHGNIELTANHTANTYILNFNANGGTGEMEYQTKTYDVDLVLIACTFTAPTGYIFGSWNLQADGLSTSFSDGDRIDTDLTYTQGEEITLYAIWISKTFEIQFVTNVLDDNFNSNISSIIVGYNQSFGDFGDFNNLPSVENNIPSEIPDAIWSGWYLSRNYDNSELINNSTIVEDYGNRTIKLFARWSFNIEYYISASEGTLSGTAGIDYANSFIYYPNGSEIICELAQVEPAEGYTFIEWTSSPEYEITQVGNIYSITIPEGTANNITLTANLSNVYLINYINVLSTELAEGTPQEYTYSSSNQNITIPNPTRANRDFYGWIASGPCSINGTTLTINAGSTDSISLTANWIITNTFVNNNNLINRGDFSTADAINSFTGGLKNNISFNSDGYYTINFDAADVNLLTVWVDIPIDEYEPSTEYLLSMNVKVDSYSAGSGGYAGCNFMVENTLSELTLFGEEYFNVSEYTIGGWANISRTITTPDTSIGTVQYFRFLIFVKNWTGNFSINNISLSKLTDTQTTESQPGESIGTLPTVANTGYTFNGWFTQPIGGTQITESIVSTEPSTYYAQWSINSYNISYVMYGGEHGGEHPSSYVYNKNVQTLTLANPIKAYSTFDVWSRTSGPEASVSGTSLTISAEAIGDIILVANWDSTTYLISYNLDGGTHEAGYPTTHTYGSETLLLSATKEEYVFAGWFENPSFSGSKLTTLSATGYDSDITLYAKWIKSLTISFNNDTAAYKGSAFDLSAPSYYTINGLLLGDVISSISYTPVTVENVGTYTITPSGVTGITVSDYSISYIAGSFSISKISLVKPELNDSTFTYSASTISVSLNSDYNSTYMGNYGDTSGMAACNNMLYVYLKNTSNTQWSDGTTSTLPLRWSILRADLTITKTGGSATYTGSEISVPSEFTTSGLKGSDSVTSISYSPINVIDAGSHAITPSEAVGTGIDNYNISYSAGTFIVGKLSLTRPALDDTSFTYNGSTRYVSLDSDYDSDYMSTYGDSSGTNVDSYTLYVNLKDTSNTQWSNGTTSTLSLSWSISKANLTITKTGGSATYTGSAISVPSGFTTSGLKGSDSVTSISYSPTSVINAETHTITPSSAIGTGLSNYNISYVAGTFAVEKLSLTKPALDDSSFTYNGSTRYVSLDSDYDSDYMSTYGDSSGTNVDSYTLYVNLKDTSNTQWSNGTTSTLSLSWSISKANLTITKTGGSATYTGSAISVPSGFTTSGLKGSDSVTSISYSPTSVTNAETHTITPSSAIGTGLSNYNISYVAGTFAVEKLSLTKPALTNTSFVYNGTTRYAVLNGDYLNAYMYYDGTASATNVDDYTLSIYLRSTSNTQWSDGTIATLSLGWTITKADLTIKFTNQSVNYNGGSVISVSAASYYTITGLKSGDSVTSVSYSSTPSTIRYVGTYTVTPSSASGTGLSNYNITYSSGTLTVRNVAQAISLYVGEGLTVTVNGSTYSAGSHTVYLYWDSTYTFSASEVSPQPLTRIDWAGSCGPQLITTSISYKVSGDSGQNISAEIWDG